MSTTASTTEPETRTDADGRSPPASAGEPQPGLAPPPRPTTGPGRPDRWADSTADRPGASQAAPLAFDPFCTRRLRNCIDGENAALPDTR